MSALGHLIDSAVATAISEHPKLFDPKQVEKAQRILVREIMKSLVREPNKDGEEAGKDEATPATTQFVPADDPRALGYTALRSVAGALAPRRMGDGSVYVPAQAQGECVKAFAVMSPRSEWPFVSDRRQLIAWREFFSEILPDVTRRDISETKNGVVGAHLPWVWPPSKTGRTYDSDAKHESETAA